MSVAAGSRRLRSLSTTQALLFGTLVVGVLDLADALIFFGLRGAQPIRILQSIASGLLGRDAFVGGWQSAALGVFLHFSSRSRSCSCFCSRAGACRYWRERR